MGMAGALIGGALLGATLMKGGSSSTPTYSNSSQIAYQNAVSTMPETPDAPVSPDDGTKSDAILAAEEEERKKRAAEAEANKTNFTGGLGLTTPANIQRKTLLG